MRITLSAIIWTAFFLVNVCLAQDPKSVSILDAVTANNDKTIQTEKEKAFIGPINSPMPGVQQVVLPPWLVGLSLDNGAMKQTTGNTQGVCNQPNEETPKNEFSPENLPEDLKKDGWHVLFEVQFAPTEVVDKKKNTFNSKGFNSSEASNMKWFLKTKNIDPNSIPNSISDFSAWASQNQIPMSTNANQALILQKLIASYGKSTNDGIATLKNYSQQMSDSEYLNFISRIAGWIDYNDDRAAFMQTSGGGKGVVTTADQLTGNKYGICGDIHSMVARMAEVRGWEAVTLGYALPGGGGQHVIAAVIDPAHPNDVHLVNYGTITNNKLNDPNHSPLSTTDDWHEMGTQVRMFKNKLGNGLEGDMVQIGEIPTALGNFFRDLVVKDYEAREKAFNGDQNFRQNKVGFEKVNSSSKTKDNGVETNKKSTNGISIFEGAVDGGQIWGLAVSHDVFKEINKPNGDLRRLGYNGISLATSLVTMNRDATSKDPLQALYVYLNMRGGRIYTLKETRFVKLQGLIGYELSGFMATNAQYGGMEAADGTLNTFAQLLGQYNKNGTHITFAGKMDMFVGLQNQNLMTDLKEDFTGNIRPFKTNAISEEVHLKQDLKGTNLSLTFDEKVTLAHFGNRVFLSAGVISGNSKFSAGYAGGLTNLRLPGTSTNTNFMTNQGPTLDGFFVGYDGSYKFKTLTGNFGATAGYNPDLKMPFVNAKATINLNLSKPKPRAPAVTP